MAFEEPELEEEKKPVKKKKPLQKKRSKSNIPTKTLAKPEGNKIKIIKSDNDVKMQKYIVLPNNMKCLIISDPKTIKSAASIELMVGSLNDTDEFKGTAKFLQGMLLKGSAKYPSYENYEEFL